MNYSEHIQRVIDYIEVNIKDYISLEDCAKVSGYSMYHFTRIFGMTVGMSPMDYLRRRRYTRIVYDLDKKPRPIKDIAFEYGFNSQENFIRAFQKEFGITPGSYRNSGIWLHLIDKPNLARSVNGEMFFKIQPEIIKKEAFYLCGYSYQMSRNDIHWQIPSCWNKYLADRRGDTLPCSRPLDKRIDIGLSMSLSDEKNFIYIIGTEISLDRKDLIDGLHVEANGDYTVSYVPEAQYAVFHTPVSDAFTFVENIHRTWSFIYSEWLPASDWVRGIGYDFEMFCERTHSYTEDIYIPVERK